jgi:O-succinylbenzoic acid--CoA ligase
MSLIINHKLYSRAALRKLCPQKLADTSCPEWEQKVYCFISEWLDDEPTIKANTSGSTGAPKTITLQKTAMEYSARMTADYLGLKPGDTALLALSPDYIAGKMMIVRAFVNGFNLLLAEPTGNPLENIPPDTTIDFTALVPMQIKKLLAMKHARLNDRLGRIRNIILGGQAVSAKLREELKTFPNNIYETFGMTETISHIAMRRISGADATDLFETVDEGIILGQDDRDCLVIVANELSPQPVVTNDVVELVDERHFRWLGRVDNVINSGGFKIIAEDLEHRIAQHFNHRFIVAGKQDEELGQKLLLIIEAPEYTAAQLEELRNYLQNTVIRYELPKEILFLEEFPETGTHKINRKEILSRLNITG